MSPDHEPKLLIAGVGNAWLRDDGFGGEVIKRLSEVELEPGIALMDAGNGGLDLAYEVMHGYDALVIVDVSRQGGKPGTLYVIDVPEASVDAGIEDGDTINPHGMDPKTMLRFVRSVGAWPGKVVVVACEPAEVQEMGLGLSDEVSAAVQDAVDLVLSTASQLRAQAAATAG
jgi:hydrogenase maturation protease